MKKAEKWIFTFFLIAALLGGTGLTVYGEGQQDNSRPESLYALSAVLLDGESGRILYEKNGTEQRPMASTTKIMTCILTLENGNLDDLARTSAYAASMPKVHLGVVEGEEFRVKDLLYSLMLESHNDAAVILAEHVGGSVQGFAKKMNAKAAKIGCKNTWFITPNGLDAEEVTKEGKKIHATTAADLARIMQYCIKESPQKEAFLKITRTSSYSFSDASENRSYSCVNHNAFLSMMPGALSGKTGFTAKAGYCYVGALERDGKTLIVALLACGWPNNKSYKWSDTRKLMDYGLENYSVHALSEAELPTIPDCVTVRNGQSRILGDKAQAALQHNQEKDRKLLLREDEKIEVKYQGVETLEAPVRKGDKVGELIYQAGGQIWKKEEVVAAEGVGKIDFAWCLKQTIERLAAGIAR